MNKYNQFKAIGLDIWVSIDYLISKNVPKGTILNGVARFKQAGGGKWKHILDDQEGKHFFDLKFIPRQTCQKYKLNSSEEIISNYGVNLFKDENELRLFEKKQFLIQVFSIIAKNRWNLYTAHYNQFYPDFKLINLLAGTHAVINEIILLSDENYPLQLIFEAYQEVPVSVQLYYRPNTYQTFRRKINECKMRSIESVLPHKSLRKKSNNLKLTEYWCNRMISIYSNGAKLTKTMVQRQINEERMQKGLSTLTYSTVNSFLNQPEIKNVTLQNRHGRRAFQNSIEPYFTMTSEASNEIWEIDGFNLPFRCEIADEQLILDVVFVIDVFSKKIMGHSIGKNENTEMIITAVRNSIGQSGFYPADLVHDNYTPYYSRETCELKEKMKLVGVNWRPTLVDKPRQKGTIERVVGTLHSAYFRLLYGYLGEGIKSKREYSLPSNEKILEYRKKGNSYTLNQLSLLVNETIEKYNETSIDGKPSSRSKYDQSLSSKNVYKQNHVKAEDYGYLFYQKNEYKIRNSMVTLSRDNAKLNYTLPPELRNQLNGTRVIVYYNSENFNYIHVFSSRKEKEFYCTLSQDMKVPRRTQVWSKEIGDYVSMRRKQNTEHIEIQRKFLENARSHSLEEEKRGMQMSRRFLIEGIDDKVIHKNIISKELLDINKEDIEKFSLNIMRKSIDQIF